MIFQTLLLFTFMTVVAAGNKLDKNITIDSLSILKSPYVHMKNESAVFEKINGIVSEGVDKLKLITDFDKTLTKQHDNSRKSLQSYEILFRCKQLPQSSVDIYNAMLLKYNAIEFDPTVDPERRKEVTNEMYKTAHEQLKGYEFDRHEIEEVVRKYGPPFRNRTKELFLTLKSLHIPAVIFSAGLSDILEEQLHQENIHYDNIHIIANHIKFNGTMLDGLQNHENLVTPLNKHEHLNQYVNSENLKNRKNIILMGDNIGDAAMINVDSSEIVLKIGFLYNLLKTEESLKIYEEKFDIVLNDDQTMNVILDIIKLI